MKTVLKLEELVKFLAAFALWLFAGFDWWLFWLLLLAPDIGMLGYAFGTRAGAVTYNFFHHKGIALLVGLAGLFFNEPLLLMAGLILYGHSSMDRMFGYGLKYPDNFKNTHLGQL